MAKDKQNQTYWPHMILGFVVIGITLGYWTIKSAIKMPVHESNEHMMKYQKADLNANEIIEAQQRFDARYRLKLEGLKPSDFKPEHLKRRAGTVMALEPVNTLRYRLTDREGNPVSDANVTLLLTRPHTEVDDRTFPNLPYTDGAYTLEKLEIQKPGRYILRVRAQKGDAIGYMDTEAYLKPSEK